MKLPYHFSSSPEPKKVHRPGSKPLTKDATRVALCLQTSSTCFWCPKMSLDIDVKILHLEVKTAANSPPPASVVFLQGSGEFHVLQTFTTQIPQVLLRDDGVDRTLQRLDEILNSIHVRILWPLVLLAGIFPPRRNTESLKIYTFDSTCSAIFKSSGEQSPQ